jgi:hypothetical protein
MGTKRFSPFLLFRKKFSNEKINYATKSEKLQLHSLGNFEKFSLKRGENVTFRYSTRRTCDCGYMYFEIAVL